MKDFAIDPHSNKFLVANRQMQFTASRLDYMAQKVRCALSLFLGEWFLDATLGIPYIPTSDTKTAHRPLLEAAIQTKITSVEGIQKLSSFSVSYSPGSRALSVSFVALTDEGETLEVSGMEIPASTGGAA